MYATQHKPANDASNARMYRCCSRYAVATSYCMAGPRHGIRQDALRHDIYFHGQKRAPSATGMHMMHMHDDKASTEFVHAPRCGLHAICVAVVTTFRSKTGARLHMKCASLCEKYFIACKVMEYKT